MERHAFGGIGIVLLVLLTLVGSVGALALLLDDDGHALYAFAAILYATFCGASLVISWWHLSICIYRRRAQYGNIQTMSRAPQGILINQ